jgi:hypothetical protein
MKYIQTVVLFICYLSIISCHSNRSADQNPLIQYISEYNGDLQQLIDEAPDHAVLVFVPDQEYPLEQTITIDKPLTIKGLSAKVPAGLPIHAISVQHEGVTIDQMRLTGNARTVDVNERKALLSVQKGHFLIENSSFLNSSKDGIEVSNPDKKPIEHGIIRNIIGRGNLRDLVSINGENDGRIHHLLIEHIRCYNHPYRGAVEVSDGTENITVRMVFADSCLYAIDVQDHGYPDVVNHEILIEGIIARNCMHAIRTANSDIGHARHIFRDITAIDCQQPLRLSNINNLYMDNVTISGQTEDSKTFAVTNCRHVTISNVLFQDIRSSNPALSLLNCDEVYISHVQLAAQTAPTHGISFEINDGSSYNTLMIFDSVLQNSRDAGIYLSARNGSTLSEAVIKDNLASVERNL